MKYDPARFGRNSTMWADQWKLAAELNEFIAPPAEWVPWMAVYLAEGVQPRDVDREVAERYAEAFADLPPIRVQKDTFALIDGRHRLEAARMAHRDHVLIIEEDISDADLAEAAFAANLEHGRPYQTHDRVRGLKLLVAKHPDWSNALFVKHTGLSYNTVMKVRNQVQKKEQVLQNAVPATRVGVDGKEYAVRPTARPANTPGDTGEAAEERAPQAGFPLSVFEVGTVVRDLRDSANRRSGTIVEHRADGSTVLNLFNANPARVAFPSATPRWAAQVAPVLPKPAPVAQPPVDDDTLVYAPFSFVEDAVHIVSRVTVSGPATSRTRDAFERGFAALRAWAAKIEAEGLE